MPASLIVAHFSKAFNKDIGPLAGLFCIPLIGDPFPLILLKSNTNILSLCIFSNAAFSQSSSAWAHPSRESGISYQRVFAPWPYLCFPSRKDVCAE